MHKPPGTSVPVLSGVSPLLIPAGKMLCPHDRCLRGNMNGVSPSLGELVCPHRSVAYRAGWRDVAGFECCNDSLAEMDSERVFTWGEVLEENAVSPHPVSLRATDDHREQKWCVPIAVPVWSGVSP